VRFHDFAHGVVPLVRALFAGLVIGIAKRLATEAERAALAALEDGELEVGAATFAVGEAEAVKSGDATAAEKFVDAVGAEAEFVAEAVSEGGGEADGETLDLVALANVTQSAGQKIVVEGVGITEIIVGVTGVEAVVLINLVVSLEDSVFIFLARLTRKEKLAGDAVGICLVGRGIERQDFLHDGIEAYAGDVVAHAGSGDVDGLAGTGLRVGVGEHAGFEGGSGHDGGVGEGGDEAITLIVKEEEGLVLNDGPTDGASVEVADIGIFGGRITGEWIDLVIEVIAGAERVPAAELEEVAVEIVGTTTSDDVDDGAVVAAVFGSEVVGEDAEFLRRVWIFRDQAAEGSGNVCIVIVCAIKQEIVVALASAVDGDAAEPVGLGDAGAQEDELVGIAEDEGKLGHLGVLDDVAWRGGIGVNLRDVRGGDFDCGGDGADFELGVEREDLVNRKSDLVKLDSLETGFGEGENIDTWLQAGDAVGAGVGRDGGARDGGRHVGSGDTDTDSGRAGSIQDSSGNLGGLRAEDGRRSENSQKD
jgi:hypothetical protein